MAQRMHDLHMEYDFQMELIKNLSHFVTLKFRQLYCMWKVKLIKFGSYDDMTDYINF